MKTSALSNSRTEQRQNPPTPKKLPSVVHTGFKGPADSRKSEICRLLEIANRYLAYAGEQMEPVFGRHSVEMAGLGSVQEELRKLKTRVKQ